MPEPILTGLLTAALFRAVEKIWEESAKAAWTPGTDAIRARVLRWTGKDRESQRRAAFDKAATTARGNTVKRAGDPATARKVLDLLDGKVDKRVTEALAEEGAKLLLFADQPDLNRLTQVCQRTVGFEAIVSGEETLPAATIAPVLSPMRQGLPRWVAAGGRANYSLAQILPADARPPLPPSAVFPSALSASWSLRLVVGCSCRDYEQEPPE